MKSNFNLFLDYRKIIPAILILVCCITCAFLIHKDYGLHVDSLSIRSIGGEAAVYAYAKTDYFLSSEEKIDSYLEKSSTNYSVVGLAPY